MHKNMTRGDAEMIANYVLRKEKIQAVKHVKDVMGLGLKDAKDVVDGIPSFLTYNEAVELLMRTYGSEEKKQPANLDRLADLLADKVADRVADKVMEMIAANCVIK